MSTSISTTYCPDITIRGAGYTTKHPGKLFSIQSNALARVAENFQLNEFWKAIEARIAEDPDNFLFGGLPSSISTETEGVSKFWTTFHAREKNGILMRRFEITTFSDTGWGLIGHIIVKPADENIPWMMFPSRKQGLPNCTNFSFNYEGGWGDHSVMKRDFMLLRLKGELDGA